MSYNLIALDLDGTLTDSGKRITPRTKETLFKAMDMGAKIILASGRPDIGVAPVARELELNERGGYILAFNGGRIIDCKSGRVIRETPFPKEYFSEAVSLRKKFDGVEVLSYSSSGIIAGGINKYVEEECRCNSCGAEETEDLIGALKENVIKFLAVGDHEKLLPAKDYLVKNFSDKFGAYFSQPFFLEIVPFGIDKAAAISFLLSYLGADKSSLMACGDGDNDIPMLKTAALSVAMENASDSVKACCSFITKSNDDDGVAYAVEKFVLRGEKI